MRGYTDNSLNRKYYKGFTLAETLITLVVIGIVAALTVPTLIQKHRKAFAETRLKSAYSILANMFKAAEVDYGSFSNWDFGDITAQTADYDDVRDVFINKYILPYVKVAYDKKETFLDFGYKQLYSAKGTKTMTMTSTQRFLVFDNGLTFWIMLNGSYMPSSDNYVSNWAEITVDIDGPKSGPNAYGKDLFIFLQVFTTGVPLTMFGEYSFKSCYYYNSTSPATVAQFIQQNQCTYMLNRDTGVVTFTPFKTSRESMISGCKNAGTFCGALIRNDGWRIADDYPWF